MKGSRLYSSKKTMPTGIEKKLLELIKKNKENKNYKNKDLSKLLTENLLKIAYNNIKSKPGNLTEGSDKETLDGIKGDWFKNTEKKISTGELKFKPSKRIEIPKKDGKTRPLGIPTPKDKIIQEAMRIILEAIFEPTFLENSHGFRPEKGCHTAFNYIRMKFGSYIWGIEGDITKCFDEINHKILINILEKRISDQVFMDLIRKSLKAGYVSLTNNYIDTYEGTPQGSIISPILANIYLHGLDEFLKELKEKFDKGTRRKENPEYRKILYKASKDPINKSKILRESRKKKIPIYLGKDENYKRLSYIRYADDFLICIIGSKKDCEMIKEEVKKFLKEKLNLELNENKTKITNLSKNRVNFLGMEIHQTPISKRPIITVEKNGKKIKVSQTTRTLLSAPISKLIEKLRDRKYCRKDFEPTRVGRLIHDTPTQIVNHFKLLWLGIRNYYSISSNFCSLNRVYYILFYSCVLTLASKLRLRTKKKVINKFGKYLTITDDFGKLLTSFPAWGRPQKKSITNNTWSDTISPANLIVKISKMVNRTIPNFSGECHMCGSTKNVEMHHVKHIKKVESKKQDFLTQQMRKMNRKQVPLCLECHIKVHKGKYDGKKL